MDMKQEIFMRLVVGYFNSINMDFGVMAECYDFACNAEKFCQQKEQQLQEEYRKNVILSETIRIAEQAMIHRDLSPSEAISLAKEFVEVANEFVNKE